MMSLTQMLTKAFTATEPPVQTHGEDFDPEKHEILGDIPLPLQWMHTLTCQLANEANQMAAALQQPDGSMTMEQIQATALEIEKAYVAFEMAEQVKIIIANEAFPADQERYEGMIIMKDWKMAARLRKEGPGDRLANSLFVHMMRMRDGDAGNAGDDILRALGGGMIIMKMGGRRR